MEKTLSYEERVARHRQLYFEFDQARTQPDTYYCSDESGEVAQLRYTIAGLALHSRHAYRSEDQALVLGTRLLESQCRGDALAGRSERMEAEFESVRQAQEEHIRELERYLAEQSTRLYLERIRDCAKPCANCASLKAALNRLVTQHNDELKGLKQDYELQARVQRQRYEEAQGIAETVFKEQYERLRAALPDYDVREQLKYAQNELNRRNMENETLTAENYRLSSEMTRLHTEAAAAALLRYQQKVLLAYLETSSHINYANITKIAQMQQLFELYDAQLKRYSYELYKAQESIANSQTFAAEESIDLPKATTSRASSKTGWWRSKSRSRK